MSGRYADPTYDFVFKRVFGDKNHKDVTIDFLNNILDHKSGSLIKDVSFGDPFIQKRNDDDGYTIFDVYCTDEKNNTYIVEIQRKSQTYFKERCQDYAARALSRQLAKKRDYKKLQPVILVAVSNFKLFDHERYISHHDTRDRIDNKRYLTYIEYCFIELPKFLKKEDELTNDADRWIYFLAHAADCLEKPKTIVKKNKAIDEAFEIVDQVSWSKEELMEYDKYLDLLGRNEDILETAKKTGEKIGIEKGRDEERLAVARTMLTKKMTLEDIAEITGLAVEVIKKIK